MNPILLSCFKEIIPKEDVNYNNPLIFYLVEIIGFCFFMAITPIDVVIIYCLISMVSILVGYYAGEKFSWYKIIC